MLRLSGACFFGFPGASGSGVRRSDSTAVVGPMQQRLPLLSSTSQVSLAAVHFDLGNVSYHRLPPADLPFIIGAPPAPIVAAVPLKPASGVFRIDPALLAPVR